MLCHADPRGIRVGLHKIFEIWDSTAVAVKSNICWHVTSCRLVEIYSIRLHSQWITPANSDFQIVGVGPTLLKHICFPLPRFFHRRFITTPIRSSCAGVRTHILSLKVDNLLGNINLDTPKRMNAEMKTGVGIAWRIVVLFFRSRRVWYRKICGS